MAPCCVNFVYSISFSKCREEMVELVTSYHQKGLADSVRDLICFSTADFVKPQFVLILAIITTNSSVWL